MEIKHLREKIKSRRGVPPPGKDTITFLNCVSKQPGEKVLDLGCGSGLIAIYFALKGKKVTVKRIAQNIFKPLQPIKQKKLKNIKVSKV